MNQRTVMAAKILAGLGLLAAVTGFIIDSTHTVHPLSRIGMFEARAQAVKLEKPIFIDVSASWCPPCRKMEATVFTNDTVKKYLDEHFIVNQVDANDQTQNTLLEDSLGVDELPTMIVLRPDGIEWKRHSGSFDAKGFLAWLNDPTDAFMLRWPPVNAAFEAASQRQKPCLILWVQKEKDLVPSYDLFRNAPMQALCNYDVVPTVIVEDQQHFSASLAQLTGSTNAIAPTSRAIVLAFPGGKLVRQISLDGELRYNPKGLVDTLHALLTQKAGS